MFSDSFFPVVGGREFVIDNLVKALKENNDCFVCAPKMKGEIVGKSDKELPYEVFRSNSMRFGKELYLSIPNKKFKKIVEAKKPDIIHCQTKFGLLSYAFRLRKKYNIPVVTTIHTNYREVYKRTLPKLIAKVLLKRTIRQLNKCDLIFAVSNYMRQQVESLGVTRPIVLLKNGIDPYKATLTKDEQIKLVNSKFGFDEDTFVFLFVGRVYVVKNIMFQLETIKDIIGKTNKKFKFLIVGDGPDKEEYQKFCKDNNMENHVHFAGQITDKELLSAIYARSNIFYFASLSDNDPLTIVEASFNSTPSLVIKDTGGAERIENLKNGFVCKNDKAEIEKLMIDLIENKYDLKVIGENAKRDIPENWQDVAKKTEIEYKKVIAKYKNK